MVVIIMIICRSTQEIFLVMATIQTDLSRLEEVHESRESMDTFIQYNYVRVLVSRVDTSQISV